LAAPQTIDSIRPVLDEYFSLYFSQYFRSIFSVCTSVIPPHKKYRDRTKNTPTEMGDIRFYFHRSIFAVFFGVGDINESLLVFYCILDYCIGLRVPVVRTRYVMMNEYVFHRRRTSLTMTMNTSLWTTMWTSPLLISLSYTTSVSFVRSPFDLLMYVQYLNVAHHRFTQTIALSLYICSKR
jgi:hypothetical protein